MASNPDLAEIPYVSTIVALSHICQDGWSAGAVFDLAVSLTDWVPGGGYADNGARFFVKHGDEASDGGRRTLRHNLSKNSDDVSQIPGGCFVAGTLVAVDTGLVPIEMLRVGDRVLTTDTTQWSSMTSVDPSGWCRLKVRMANPEYVRDSFDIDMIRPHDWTIVSRMRPGGKVEVALDEMGLSGTGILQSIEPCPDIREGSGRVVLATVTHANSYIHRLRFEGSEIDLELTDRHRLYSITRNDWIATEHLEPGEALQTEYGVIVLSENVRLRGTQVVYNLQVETDECYYVSEERVLSHNTNPCGAGGAKASSSVDDLINSSTPGNKTLGKSTLYERTGGINQANKDFDALNPSDVKNIPSGRIGKLSDGRSVIVRTESRDGRPTLEIQKGKRRTKFRYDD